MSAGDSRFGTIIAIRRLDRSIRKARHVESVLVSDAGAAIAESTAPAVAADAAAQELRARIASIVRHMAALDGALDDSFKKDQQDYAQATQLMRWVVVARGILDRFILKDHVRYDRHERERLTRELGLLAGDPAHAALLEAVPVSLRDALAMVRAEAESLQQERERRLAPWHGEALPGWLTTIQCEGQTFLRFVWKQLLGKIFLSAPALGAMVGAWWIAHAYTDDRFERALHRMGLSGRDYMSPETLRLLKFCVPILAGAFCAYLVATISVRVQRKYALKDEGTPSTAGAAGSTGKEAGG